MDSIFCFEACAYQEESAGFLMYFVVNAILFGIGLAMDAFSVSVANGLNEPKMSLKKESIISLTFGAFQFIMPMIGWFCVSFLLETFEHIEPFIPYVSLILLLYIGGKMIYEAAKGECEEEACVGAKELVLQGIATSIDALSVGFTIATLSAGMALVESLIIGAVTVLICYAGVEIGKRFGTRFSRKASIAGGLILIFIGVEIFVKGVL